MLNILVVSNGWTIKMSGGDKHMLEAALRWQKKVAVGWVVPQLGYELNREDYFSRFGNLTIIPTPWEKEATLKQPLYILLTYLWRTAKACWAAVPGSYQVVVASSHFLFDVVPVLFLSRKEKARSYVYVHHIISNQRGRRGGVMAQLSQLNERVSLALIKKFFAGVIVVSPLVAEELIHRGFKREQLMVSSNGVQLDFITSIPEQAKKYAAVFVGRLTEHKGIFDLVKIWDTVSRIEPDAKLAVVGSGPEKERLVSAIKGANLEKSIDLLGYLTEEDKIKVLKQSRLFLFPSPEEGWGIVIAEAMAAGLPVVAYDLPAYTKVFPKGMVKIALGDWEKMAGETVKLLANDDQRLLLALEGQALVRDYDIELVADKELRYVTVKG